MVYPANYTNLPESATDATPDGSGGFVPATGTLLTADATINNNGKGINRIEQQALGLSSDGPGSTKVFERLKMGERGQVTRDTVAAAATLTLPEAGVVVVTGTGGPVTAITATGNSGRRVVLDVTGAVQFTDNGGTLNLGSNFTGPGRLLLVCDGTNWKVEARSDAGTFTYATTAELADVAATEAAGTSPTLPRGDHVHALGILTTLGDLLIRSTAAIVRLAGNTTTTRKFLRQTGTGSASADPAWDTLQAGDLPVMGASGGSHAAGAVPDPGSSAGSTRFLREDATWATPAGGGGSGNSTSTAAYGSRPAPGTAGDLFLPSDGYTLQRDTGAAWVPWGPLFPFTAPPAAASWTWVNQGSATVADDKGAVYLDSATAAGDSLRCLVMNAPATPYTITAAFWPAAWWAPSAASFGLLFRSSGDSKLSDMSAVILNPGGASPVVGVGVRKWTNPTTFSANYLAPTAIPQTGGLFWFQLTDNGTNRIYSMSRDGQHWTALTTIGRTDVHTADQVGFFANAHDASLSMAVLLVSWAQT